MQGNQERIIDIRSREDEETGEKRRRKDRQQKSQLRSTENIETTMRRRRKDRLNKSQLCSTENVETRVKRRRKNTLNMARSKMMLQTKQRRRNIYARKTRNWKNELIDKSSLIYICTSECRYRPKGSVVLVSKQKFTEYQLDQLSLNNDSKSIDGNFYICKACRNALKKNRIPSCNEKKYKFLIDNLPEDFLVPGKSLSKLEAHLLKLVIPFIRIAQVPGYGEFKIKGLMITVEADVKKTLNEKILPRQQELIPVALKRKSIYKKN